jgi:two-component system response regulator AdeR
MPLILVVEDEHAELLAEAIERQTGYRVIIAGDGPTGIDMARVYKPDAIVMDVRLPSKDGFAATAAIRQFDTDVPILVVTAYSDRYTRQAAREVGANIYLRKPVDLNILVSQLQEWIRGKKDD